MSYTSTTAPRRPAPVARMVDQAVEGRGRPRDVFGTAAAGAAILNILRGREVVEEKRRR